MPDVIQLRRGTAAAWTAANPTLAAGEPGFETDTGKLKIGDGATAWNSLAYENVDTLATVMARGATTALQLTSTLAVGTSPFAVTSTTVNTNLNADLLDGYHASVFATKTPTLATKTDDYDVQISDGGSTLVMNAAGDKTFTLPAFTWASHAGWWVRLCKRGAGKVTIDAYTNGAAINGGGTLFDDVATETEACVDIQLLADGEVSIVGGVGSWETAAAPSFGPWLMMLEGG